MQIQKIQELNEGTAPADSDLLVVSESDPNKNPLKMTLLRMYNYVFNKLKNVYPANSFISPAVPVIVGEARALISTNSYKTDGIIASMTRNSTGMWTISLREPIHSDTHRVVGMATGAYVASDLHQKTNSTQSFQIRIADDDSPNDYDFMIYIEYIKRTA